MRPLIVDFARDLADGLPLRGPVIEIGARPAEGQEALAAQVRDVFVSKGLEHVGCDLQEGPTVQRIEDLHALTFDDDSVETIVSFDTLEHVADPLAALREIHRVLKPGGICAISSVMFFPIHAHPWDYWRFTPEGFSLLLAPFAHQRVLAHGFGPLPETVFGIGIKAGGDADLDLSDPHLLPRTTRACATWGEDAPVDFGPIRMRTRDLWRITGQETVKAIKRRVGVRGTG